MHVLFGSVLLVRQGIKDYNRYSHKDFSQIGTLNNLAAAKLRRTWRSRLKRPRGPFGENILKFVTRRFHRKHYILPGSIIVDPLEKL